MNQLFQIFKVGSAEALKISASPDKSHQHDYEELVIGMEGQLEHFIDFKNSVMDAPLVSFVTKGKVHRAIPKLKNGKCEMWVLRFKSEFIPEITFQLYANYHNHAMLKLTDDYCFKRLTTICEIIQREMQQENPDLSVVRHLLTALFIMIESERNKISPQEEGGLNHSQNTTLQSFLQILEENYHRPVGVEFYAEKLFMSARNLNLICKNILQQTVSEIIETRKLIEAKNQLTYSDKNISEIGFDLGYNEKAYFTNVFKKRTGQTPSEFREEMKKLFS
ncbi:helix-turn-helix domain-containing protein [Cecembia calidifontis]|uniref:AraC family transcriptional regulator n=1 Tax=Cecembia calidifontis TaxID=1187080 RepID=A0A4Q7P7F3_9BACT|nr:AraC family transcriptional regulator [Cecembia calidifontis]RZS95448.1 AraC family transcriptional regulator [Cecembia calidifontis]